MNFVYGFSCIGPYCVCTVCLSVCLFYFTVLVLPSCWINVNIIAIPFLADMNSRSRSLIAVPIPFVVCLSVCCLWRWCTLLRRLNFSAIFFHHTIAQGVYFSGAKNRWWETPLSPWNLRSKWPTFYQTAKFRPISAHSASTVIASEKSSICTYRKSTTRFPTRHR